MWLRLRQIALIVPDLEPAVAQLCALFDLEVGFRDPNLVHYGLANAVLPLGNQFIEVVAPTRDGTAGGRYLQRRGAGGYMVITQCDDHAPRRRRVEELGIRIVNQFTTHEFNNLQMHPKDTGGSFFEIDEQRGANAWAPDGPWEPAGSLGWQSARRTQRVAGIAAAEIQCDDPASVAARWATIAELPVLAGAAPSIRLDNATLRFVPCTDGRPEGLGGLDLVANDRAAVLATATAHGAAVSGNQVSVCGMRFNLV